MRLLELVNYPDKAVRSLSIKAIAILCSSRNNHFVTNLLQADLLDRLYKSITTFEQSQREKLVFLWICESISMNGCEDLDVLLRHECLGKIIEYAHPSEQSHVRTHSLGTLKIMLGIASYSQTECIFNIHRDLLAMLVHNLTNPNEPADVIARTLKCLISLVKNYNNIYTPIANNKVVYELERICQIENITDELTRHQNSQVEKNALELANLIGQCQTFDI
jgi:hypothetical protein